MGRFFPYEKALVEAVEGGVYVFTGGRVTWGCHGVVVWLTQANSSVGQRCIYCLLVYIKNLYVLYFHYVYVL